MQRKLLWPLDDDMLAGVVPANHVVVFLAFEEAGVDGKSCTWSSDGHRKRSRSIMYGVKPIIRKGQCMQGRKEGRRTKRKVNGKSQRAVRETVTRIRTRRALLGTLLGDALPLLQSLQHFRWNSLHRHRWRANALRCGSPPSREGLAGGT